MFASSGNQRYRDQMFDITHCEEGGPEDRPLIVQFWPNNPDQLLAAAQIVQPYCDAIDVNLGCPQDIARKGYYGAFLQEDWDLIEKLSGSIHKLSAAGCG